MRSKLFMVLLLICSATNAIAQRSEQGKNDLPSFWQTSAFDALQWRFVGTHRGGRASGVCGVPGQANVFYMASTGGGVWKTTDGGNSWNNVSDGFFGGSIGAVRVSMSDPNVVYAGCGEKTVRGNVSPGYGGVYRSNDAGKSWFSVGLPTHVQIGEIRIHPDDPDIAFVAVLGDLFKDSEERGLYKTIDGGVTWKKVLYANPAAGAVDVCFDPNNPRIMFASTWNVRRTPYSLSSGGEGSGLWKSTDMGETWVNISDHKGLPKGTLGIIGVSVSGANSNRVYAMVEAEEGGLFRSDNGGERWERVSADRNLRQRAWYYSKVFADPQNADRVYVMNVQFWRSDDGGRNFKSYSTPHGDHHDLWIAPEDNNRLIVADDGGAQVSYDAGENWSTYMNQPTAQYYRVTTDDVFPYRIYVAQQDNSTQRIPHRVASGRWIGEGDWEATAGGESAHIAPDPDDPDIVYGGSYGGYLSRVNHRTDEYRVVDVWPDNPMGHGAEDFKYRFQWNFPLFFSPHDPDKLYAASNHLHVSTDEGQSWKLISPDLTRNEAEKLGASGGPITKDNTGVEYYASIFAVCESPYEEGLLWAASDDGMVHVSKDGGEAWKDVTPKAAPTDIMWNSVAPDPFSDGGLYLAGTRYKSGDYAPYLYKTKDYGQTWIKITTGIPDDHFTRVVRPDPDRKGLLYAGTEYGAYISFDDGQHWSTMQLNLPIVPITDMVVKNKNLIAATQGRGVYILDDLTVFHQLNEDALANELHLFAPIDAYRLGGFNGRLKPPKRAGQNHHNGVAFYFHLKDEPGKKDTIILNILEANGDTIRSFSSLPKEKRDSLRVEKGSNVFLWDMYYPKAEGFPGMILWAANLNGAKAVPGSYRAVLSNGSQQVEQAFKILADPRSTATQDDLQAQFDFVQKTNRKLSETHQAIGEIRSVRDQLNALAKRIDSLEHPTIDQKIDLMLSSMKEIEEALYQTKNQSGQDPLNYPIRLNNKLAAVKSQASYGSFAPTDQAIAVADSITQQIDVRLQEWNTLKQDKLQALNEEVRQAAIDLIALPKDD